MRTYAYARASGGKTESAMQNEPLLLDPDRVQKILELERIMRRTPSLDSEAIQSQTISIRDAIEISEGRLSADNITTQQKLLVDAVAEERKTQLGLNYTDSAAGHNIILVLRDSMLGGIRGAYFPPPLQYIAVSNLNSVTDMQSVLHHELAHSIQYLSPRPEGLSSYDLALWQLGKEGQAFVVQAADQRERANSAPLTDQEKIAAFTRETTLLDSYTSQTENRSRNDGRRLTFDEFAEAFGTLPTEAGNFLKNAGYKDPADIFDVNSAFHRQRIVTEATPLDYRELPAASTAIERFESKDKQFAVLVERHGDQKTVSVYHKQLAFGPNDALIDDHYVMINYLDLRLNTTGSIVHTSMPYTNGNSLSIDVDIGTLKNPRSKIETSLYDPKADKELRSPISFKRIEPPKRSALDEPTQTADEMAELASKKDQTNLVGTFVQAVNLQSAASPSPSQIAPTEITTSPQMRPRI